MLRWYRGVVERMAEAFRTLTKAVTSAVEAVLSAPGRWEWTAQPEQGVLILSEARPERLRVLRR
jgi:hypothetical protein